VARLSGRAASIAVASLSLCCRAPRPGVVPEDITPHVDVTPKRLPAGDPLALSYAWEVGPAARHISREYRAFVHFVDPEGIVLFTDDHVPEPPVTSWEPGRTYAYRRIVLSRPFPHTGEVRVLAGLYPASGSGERLPLHGWELKQRAYRVDQIVFLPRDRDLVATCDGLYPPDSSAGGPLVVSRFLRREATCSFRNPGADVVLFAQGDIDPRGFATPPALTVAIGGVGAELPALTGETNVVRVRFAASDLGRRSPARVRLAMSASYVPEELGINRDHRELSLRLLGLRIVRAGALDRALLEGAITAAPLRPQ
jgi:hypothetical protein